MDGTMIHFTTDETLSNLIRSVSFVSSERYDKRIRQGEIKHVLRRNKKN